MSSEKPVALPPAGAGGSGSKLNLSVDLRWVVVALLVVIVAMVALWRPWQSKAASDSRTVSVTGEATVKATPDEFVFSPTYQFKNADKAAALKELTAKSDAIVAGLKKLGVPESGIKTNSNSYETGITPYDGGVSTNSRDSTTYVLNITVTLSDKQLTQKVQDYIVTTTPEGGSVSPYASFSTAKQKALEAQARDQATKEARSKADQSAKNLGFTVGEVKNIDDSGFGGGFMPYASDAALGTAEAKSAAPSLAVQPGENDLNYSVTVVYYIR